LFSVLFGVWVANYVAFSGDLMRELAAQFLALAEKQRATIPIMYGHRVMGVSLVLTGDISEGRAHLDQAVALYDAAEHRPLAMHFGVDARVAILSYRSWAAWLLGYPEAALTDAEQALKDARGWPRCNLDICAIPRIVHPYPLRKIRRSKRGNR
jgi:hypothetical protein